MSLSQAKVVSGHEALNEKEQWREHTSEMEIVV